MENVYANLCQCNNCECVFLDKNPQTNAKPYLVNISRIKDLSYLKDKDGEMYWGCPVCRTDAYLQDEINKDILLQIQK